MAEELTGIVVINAENYRSDGSYRYDLMYGTTAPTEETVETDDCGTITCQPGSTAHKAGYADLLELSADGTWEAIE